MMGRQSKVQSKLFYTAIDLEQRVRKNHILRKVKRNIDFDFIIRQVERLPILSTWYTVARGLQYYPRRSVISDCLDNRT